MEKEEKTRKYTINASDQDKIDSATIVLCCASEIHNISDIKYIKKPSPHFIVPYCCHIALSETNEPWKD